jgi:hypothetical protein
VEPIHEAAAEIPAPAPMPRRKRRLSDFTGSSLGLAATRVYRFDPGFPALYSAVPWI